MNIEGAERHIAKAEEIPTGIWQVAEIRVCPANFDAPIRLDKLAGLQRLRCLRLFGTQISDDGLSHLTEIPQLAYLDLDFSNATTDTSFKHIEKHSVALEVVSKPVSGAVIAQHCWHLAGL